MSSKDNSNNNIKRCDHEIHCNFIKIFNGKCINSKSKICFKIHKIETEEEFYERIMEERPTE